MNHRARPWMVALVIGAQLALVRGAAAQAPPPPPPVDNQDATNEPPPPPAQDEMAGDEEPPAEALPPAEPPAQATFEQQLAPYGRWVDAPDYGRVWIPAAATRSDWAPYTDGHWVYTQWGWSFVSDVPWGWAPFHYGRWGWTTGFGWFWVPGSVWAPAWVSWRYSTGHVTWAPYAPRGYVYPRRWPGWVTIPAQHFTHPIHREIVPREHAREIVRGARRAPSIEREPIRGRAYGPPRSTGRRGGERRRR